MTAGKCNKLPTLKFWVLQHCLQGGEYVSIVQPDILIPILWLMEIFASDSTRGIRQPDCLWKWPHGFVPHIRVFHGLVAGPVQQVIPFAQRHMTVHVGWVHFCFRSCEARFFKMGSWLVSWDAHVVVLQVLNKTRAMHNIIIAHFYPKCGFCAQKNTKVHFKFICFTKCFEKNT